MTRGAETVAGSVESMAAISEENSAAAEEVSAATQEMSARAEEVVTSAEALRQMAERLDELVARFRIEDGPGSEGATMASRSVVTGGGAGSRSAARPGVAGRPGHRAA